MPLISSLVRNFVISRLLDADPTTKGFNYWAAQLAGSVDYPNIDPFQLVTDTNFFTGAITEGVLESTAIDSVYPLVIVYSNGLRPRSATDAITPSEFSGVVPVTIDFYSGFDRTEMPMDSEDILDLAEDAIFETFTRYDTACLWANGQGFSFNNQISSNRGDLVPGGQNWRQLNRFVIQVQIGDAQPR